MVRASAVSPLMAHAMWLSISMIFSTESDSSRGDWVRFSTARTTPSDVWMPTVVEPSCGCAFFPSAVLKRVERGNRGWAHLDGLDGILDCRKRRRGGSAATS